MTQNIEFKAYLESAETAISICERMGATLLRDHIQSDTYYAVRNGRLKLRESDKFGRCLIYYERRDLPEARQSEYALFEIDEHVRPIADTLHRALDHLVIVTKHRRTYEFKSSLINVDEVEQLGTFIEVEVQVEACGSTSEAKLQAEELRKALGVDRADTLPFSYAELKSMYETGRTFRGKLNDVAAGTLFLLDGPSCSGKSTIKRRLLADKDLKLTFVPRYCTREPRVSEMAESDYLFVSQTDFDRMKMHGKFIEYRDFLFGMSYGLPWSEAFESLKSGADVLAIMNLGNVRHVKNIFPEALTILITASEDTLRQRLVERGANREEQIEERLENARWVEQYAKFYDHVIRNEDNQLAAALAEVSEIIGSRRHEDVGT